MDILQNLLTRDAVFINAPMQTSVSTTDDINQTVAQRLNIKLSTYQGEWFSDLEYGIPYFQSILGTKNSQPTVDMIMKQAILADPSVVQLVSFSSNLDTATRTYSATFQVKTNEGTITTPITINQGA
jgi:hypothetical protein